MRVDRMAVKGGGGSNVWYIGQGTMRFGEGKAREFHFRLRVGTLNKHSLVVTKVRSCTRALFKIEII